MPVYLCGKCKRLYTADEFVEDRFCRDCRTLLSETTPPVSFQKVYSLKTEPETGITIYSEKTVDTSPKESDTSEWYCVWAGDKIKVFKYSRPYGFYRLLEEPFCKVCGNPNSILQNCVLHKELYGFKRIYVMGKYIKSSSIQEDLLSTHILKLKEEKEYAVPLGEALALVVQNRYTELLRSDLIVPVPLNQEEYSLRGYNQALELAKVVGERLNIQVSFLLKKTKPLKMHTREKSLSRLERQKAVKGLYEPNKPRMGEVKGKRVILVDDVITTGFTVSECSDVLAKSGALEVNVLGLARTVM